MLALGPGLRAVDQYHPALASKRPRRCSDSCSSPRTLAGCHVHRTGSRRRLQQLASRLELANAQRRLESLLTGPREPLLWALRMGIMEGAGWEEWVGVLGGRVQAGWGLGVARYEVRQSFPGSRSYGRC